MTHEHDQTRASSPGATTEHDEMVKPGRSSRSAALRKPEQAVPSGLVQRKARDASGIADDAHHAVSAASSSSGRPLPETLTRKFEDSLGTDLSGVRVHTGKVSETAADALGAKAFAMGNDIHFAAGGYEPSSADGQHLLAHEVAHTVQQRGGAVSHQHKLEVSNPQDPAEHEADLAADAMVAGQSAQVTSASGAMRSSVVQRQTSDRSPADTSSGSGGLVCSSLDAWLGGSLEFTPQWDARHQDPKVAAAASVSLPRFSASGAVIMDASVPDDSCEVGFVQNLLSSRAISVYVDSKGHPFRKCVFTYPTPLLDSAPGEQPWLRKKSVISFNENNYMVSVYDRPNYYFVWDSTNDPSEHKLDKNDHPGQLKSASGKERFITWLVIRDKSSERITYAQWVTWNIDWACSFDHATQTGKSVLLTAAVSGQGLGQGAHVPVVSGKIANSALMYAWSNAT